MAGCPGSCRAFRIPNKDSSSSEVDAQMQTRTDARERSTVRAALIIGAMVVLLAAPTAVFAGKGQGGGGTTSTASLNLVVIDGPEATNHGDRVTFSSNQTVTDRPFVGVRCYQGAAWVLDGYVGVFDDYMFDPWVTLSSEYWAAGVDATCTARLFYFDRRGREKIMATITFAVLP